ncbi:molybdenum ABC transporter ATP-binding protein [Ancylobacter lacus]|uniref:molybdenum ABC transporter ATP-binding protein n=1 Tax=Ancylobacter lacus TaxID=2579970 RepID=UPI001BCDD16B|nr:molybdenum ABC transporter ATP-binding protein [Ancylobacter lacus]MBS7537836.1 molybdenum ABC transporter ATP-binding protein [Ancylobacter lacus]
MIEVDIRIARPGFTLEAAFSAPPAGITALFGRSGAGKTTIIQAVAGVVRPVRGRIVVDGTAYFDADRHIDLPVERRRVGYVFQDARLFPHMSVERNLRYGERRARVAPFIGFDPVVDLLGLRALLGRRPHTLSGGERQRVAIGRALLAQPRLLLMDEPLAALDEARKLDILPYIERLRDVMGVPVLYVSHSIDEVLRLSDRVVALAAGRVVAAGPVAEVMSRPDILPVVGRFDLGTILESVVVAHDAAYGLSTLGFPGGELRVPLVDVPVGAPTRARVRSRDVALALQRPEGVSVTNRLPAVVSGIRAMEGAYVDVEVAIGPSALHAMVTRESLDRLALRPGMPVWALVKTVAVDSRGASLSPPDDPGLIAQG